MIDMSEKMHSAQTRIEFLDYLRVVACFMVLAIHSAEPFYLERRDSISYFDKITFLDLPLFNHALASYNKGENEKIEIV